MANGGGDVTYLFFYKIIIKKKALRICNLVPVRPDPLSRLEVQGVRVLIVRQIGVFKARPTRDRPALGRGSSLNLGSIDKLVGLELSDKKYEIRPCSTRASFT